MVVFGNRKYACLSCIRGHRSSSCEHRDRILLQIRKPGRKPQAEPQGRFALVWKEGSADPLKYNARSSNGRSHSKSPNNSHSDYKLIRVPDIQNENLEKEPSLPSSSVNSEEDNDEVVLTSKYIFVHVGDNLFRRELRPEFASKDTQKQDGVEEMQSDAHSNIASHIPQVNHSIKQESGLTLKEMNYLSQYGEPIDLMQNRKDFTESAPIPHNGTRHNIRENVDVTNISKHDAKIPNPFTGNQNGNLFAQPRTDQKHVENDMHTSPLNSDGYLFAGEEKVAPLVIGPMQYQFDYMNRQESIFNELGMTAEEATDLWPDNPSNFSFASQCVLPGQCQCGEGCECPDCYEHNLAHRQIKHDI